MIKKMLIALIGIVFLLIAAVKWGFTTTFPRPMNIMLVVMDMDALAGKDFADGLASLKGIMEKE